jgi:hypothetical protein
VRVDPGSTEVTLKNFGLTPIDLSDWYLMTRDASALISSLTVASGSASELAGGGGVVVLTGLPMNVMCADLSLSKYADGSVGLVDYVQWGKCGQTREFLAVTKQLWPLGQALPYLRVLEYAGDGQTDRGRDFWLPEQLSGGGNVSNVLRPVSIRASSESADAPLAAARHVARNDHRAWVSRSNSRSSEWLEVQLTRLEMREEVTATAIECRAKKGKHGVNVRVQGSHDQETWIDLATLPDDVWEEEANRTHETTFQSIPGRGTYRWIRIVSSPCAVVEYTFVSVYAEKTIVDW